jgi:hypothetical protein
VVGNAPGRACSNVWNAPGLSILTNKLTETAAIVPGPRPGDDYFMPAAEVIEEALKLQGKNKTKDWLSEELIAEAEGAWPEECDIEGTPPLVKTDKLAAAIDKLFPENRWFYNMYHKPNSFSTDSRRSGDSSRNLVLGLSNVHTVMKTDRKSIKRIQ